MNITNNNELQAEAEALAEMIFNEYNLSEVDVFDAVAEVVDGSEHVIYYSKAHSICQNCDISEGEAFFRDCYGDYGNSKTYDEIACIMAYGELQYRVQNALDQLIDNSEV